jgi:hypothetical protein
MRGIPPEHRQDRHPGYGVGLDRLTGLPNHVAMTSKGGVTISVGAWLRGLGLGHYEASFRENDIDESVLQTVGGDLKELGVAHMGIAESCWTPFPLSVVMQGGIAIPASQMVEREAQDAAEDGKSLSCFRIL